MWFAALLVLLLAAAVRAAARISAARRLGRGGVHVHLGLGPALVRRPGAAGLLWSVGLLPLPLLRVTADDESAGPPAVRRRAALALSGPVAVYLAGALLATATLLVRGEEHETNVVDFVEAGAETEPSPGATDPSRLRGLRAGDQILAIYDRFTPDGESIRRFTTWVGGEDGYVEITIRRDGGSHVSMVRATYSLLSLPAGLQASPALGVSLRVERRHVGVLDAVRRGLLFPAARGSAIRWLAKAAVPRVSLRLREDPITYLPSLRLAPWSLRVADALGFFAILSLLPWPGLDGGELLLVLYQACRKERSPRWLEGLFRSPAWGVAMATLVASVCILVLSYTTDILFGRQGPPVGFRALFTWPG